MTVKELIEELQKYPQDAEVELAEEGSPELSKDTIKMDTYQNGSQVVWIGSSYVEL